jgi:hypothetical protein
LFDGSAAAGGLDSMKLCNVGGPVIEPGKEDSEMIRKVVRGVREELRLSRKNRHQKIERLRGWRELGDEGKKGQMAIDGE